VAGLQESAVELQQLVTESLGRFGVAGTVAIDGNRATLFGNGPTVELDVGPALADWDRLDDEGRRKRALDAARRLAAERRRFGVSGRAPDDRRMPAWWILATIGVALIGLGAAVLFWLVDAATKSHTPASRSAPVVDYDAYERERVERADRVCNATRSRIMRGAPVGPSDVEGWVVELSLLSSKDSPDLVSAPALSSFVSAARGPGRIVWPQAGSVANLDGPDTAATVTAANVPETGEPDFKGLRLVLTGRYVGAYFDEEARVTMVRFALALTDALHAQYAALYARCAAGRAHHLGSFFRGPTPGGAVTSLLYFIGTFGDVPDVRRSVLVRAGASADDPVFAFQNIRKAAAPLKKTRIMTMVGAEGGMISGLDDQPSTLSFPPRDPNRAARASHRIAQELGIGEER
jgi:serine/threonine-protein kinase